MSPVQRAIRASRWLLLVLLAGCALLPPPAVVPEPERLMVENAFRDLLARQHECACCLDARVTVRLKSLFYSGGLEGYLQAMRPAFVKFIGLTPLGQPLLMLVADGRRFRLVSVPDARVYEGGVGAGVFKKYAPEGLRADQAFAWLTGRLPEGPVRIGRVEKDGRGRGYWLSLQCGAKSGRHRVLFDPGAGLLLRHILLDGRDREQVAVTYADYHPEPDGVGCPLPGRVIITGKGSRNGTLEITLADFLPAARFKAGDFSLDIPAGFETVLVR